MREPFPDPAHRTGRAVFPHPALGRGSHPGMHRRPQRAAESAASRATGPGARPAWPWRTAPRGAAGALVGFAGSRQSPAPELVEAPPEPGPLPSPGVMLSPGSKRYYGPLRRPPRPPSMRGDAGRDPAPRWASRVALDAVPTCHAPYPGERSCRPRSVARAGSGGLPCFEGRSALTTCLSRPARASHVLRPVGLPIRPWRTRVP